MNKKLLLAFLLVLALALLIFAQKPKVSGNAEPQKIAAPLIPIGEYDGVIVELPATAYFTFKDDATGKLWRYITFAGLTSVNIDAAGLRMEEEVRLKMAAYVAGKRAHLKVFGETYTSTPKPVAQVLIDDHDMSEVFLSEGLAALWGYQLSFLAPILRETYFRAEAAARNDLKGYWNQQDPPWHNRPVRAVEENKTTVHPRLPANGEFKGKIIQAISGDRLYLQQGVTRYEYNQFHLAGVKTDTAHNVIGVLARWALGDLAVGQPCTVTTYGLLPILDGDYEAFGVLVINKSDIGAVMLQKGWVQLDAASLKLLPEATQRVYERLEKEARYAQVGMWKPRER